MAAGVSYQTVSRVINGHPSVRPATREIVLAAIRQDFARLGRASFATLLRLLDPGAPEHPAAIRMAGPGYEPAAGATMILSMLGA